MTRTRQVIVAFAGTTIAATAFAQPANDSLFTPITIGIPSIVAGNTSTATNDFGLVGSCGNSASAKDVWYRFDCTTSQTVEFATCNGTSFNSVLQVFTAGPSGLGTEVTCNDNACATQSRVNFAAVAGTSYIIRVAGSGTSSGAFNLTSSVPVPRTVGPDVTIGNLTDIATYTASGPGSVWKADSNSFGTTTGMRSYAVGTDSWNIGDRPVEWQSANQLHPVIGQQMYRYKNNTFEQIGISWLKHGFASTNSGGFPDLGACDSPPNGGAQLGVNCSDAYGSGLNGGRSYLGPRFDVKPITGVYTYPWSPLVGTTPSDASDPVSRRIVVLNTDVDPATNPGAEYYVDCHYVTQDDAQWNNGRNNLSTRKVNAATILSSPTFTTATTRRLTALELWSMEKSAAGDTGINFSDVNFHERSYQVTNKWSPWTSTSPDATVLPAAQWTTFTSAIQGRFIVGSHITTNVDNTYNYDYMVMNINSDRAGGSFAVRLPAGAAVSNVSFHAPMYHSGERILNNPWLNNTGAAGRMSWNVDTATRSLTVPGMASAVTFNPNALMWGTLYNFRFTTAAAPVTGNARLGLFRVPADALGFQGNSLAANNIKVPDVCIADVGSTGGVAGPDGTLDNNDFIAFIDAFFNADMLIADLGKTGGVAGTDNILDNNDFIVYIDAFFAGCGI